VAALPDLAERDPYGDGWLMKVRPSRLRANRINLMAGRAVHRWMEEAAAGLRGHVAPGLGALAQDGGVPVAGMARAIDPEGWTPGGLRCCSPPRRLRCAASPGAPLLAMLPRWRW
jgi:hypothetical protein